MIAPASNGRPDKPIKSTSAKMDREIIERAQIIARQRGVKLSDYLSEIVRAGVERDWSKAPR
jgi:ribosomal protein L27